MNEKLLIEKAQEKFKKMGLNAEEAVPVILIAYLEKIESRLSGIENSVAFLTGMSALNSNCAELRRLAVNTVLARAYLQTPEYLFGCVEDDLDRLANKKEIDAFRSLIEERLKKREAHLAAEKIDLYTE